MTRKRKWYLIWLLGVCVTSFQITQIGWYFRGEWVNGTLALLATPVCLWITIQSYRRWQAALREYK